MSDRAQVRLDHSAPGTVASCRRLPPRPDRSPEVERLVTLQRLAGNGAVAALLERRRPPTGPGRSVVVQRCGPLPCDCSPDEQAEYEAAHGTQVGDHGLDELSDASAGQRQDKPLQRDEDEPGVLDWISDEVGAAVDTASDAAGGAYDWVGDQASAAVDTVSDAAGGAYDWVGDQASAAVDTVSDAAGGAYDWVGDQASAAVDTVSDAAAGAYDWVKEQGADLIEHQRALVIGQISAARQQLHGRTSLAVSPAHLSSLSSRLASLQASAPGLGALPDLAVETAAGGDERTVSASSLDSLLTSLQTSLSRPASSPAGTTTPPVQRPAGVDDAAVAAALAAAAAAGAETAEVGGPIAVVAAPETGGLSLVVLAIVAAVVMIVVGIIVYAATRPPAPAAPAVPDSPTMPEGLSREKKQKWKDCQQRYETYKQGTGKEVSSLAGEINDLRVRYNNNTLTADQKRQLCAKLHEQIQLVERLINDRRGYIDMGCDEFDWFGQGTTEEQRRRRHEGEVSNVKAQEGNLRGLLKRLQDEGAC